MPQKKNPDAYELMRGKAGRLIGDLNGLLVTLKGLPLGYSKDLQEDKEPLFDAVDAVLAMLAVLPEMCARRASTASAWSGQPEVSRSRRSLRTSWLRKGVPFREAHRAVGRLVRRSEELGVSLEEVPRDELAAAHPALSEVPRRAPHAGRSVANKGVRARLRPARSSSSSRRPGGFSTPPLGSSGRTSSLRGP